MKSLVSIACLLFSFHASAQTSVPVSQSATTVGSEGSGKSNFGISFFSLGGYQKHQFDNDGTASMDFFDNYLTFSYRINRDVRVSARPAFGYSTAGINSYGDETTDKIRVRDFSLVLKINNLFEDNFHPAFSLSNQFRLYLPTSDSSKATGMIARLRYELEGRYRFSKKSDFRYYAKPSYYFQRTTSYLNQFNSISTTQFIDLEHGGEFSYDLNKFFSLKPGFEFGEKWSYESEVNDRDGSHRTQVRTGFGVEFSPNRDMNFTVAINDTRDLIQPEKRGGEMGTGYTLMTNITLY